ncbi:magnesium transporter [Spiroplasma clarkii]|nr:magnesium transporter [Spiroplasma clarkii]
MFLSIVVSKLIGGTLPIIAKVCKLDPAAVTTPIVTTIIDILSATAFFSIGLAFINQI